MMTSCSGETKHRVPGLGQPGAQWVCGGCGLHGTEALLRDGMGDQSGETEGRRSAEHSLHLPVARLLEQGIHSDVVFVVHGKPFRAHRCILGARSAYFANMLDTKWKGKSVVVLRHPLVCRCLGVGVEEQQGACAGPLPLIDQARTDFWWGQPLFLCFLPSWPLLSHPPG